MAQRDYDLNLKANVFPMLSEQRGVTTIGSAPADTGGDRQEPGVAYCHNVMPSTYGLDSIGYTDRVPAVAPAVTDFSDVRVVYGNARSRLYLAWTATGSVYALPSGASVWVAVVATVPATGGVGFSTEDITIGTVNGISYIYYQGVGAFMYNESTGVLDSVTLVGISLVNTLGIVAASGYLIAYTAQAIAWSSTIDPADFVPSAVTGAGGGNVAGIGGKILFMLTNPLGFIIYTATNAIAASYTGNIQYPFKFRPIDDSKGGISLDKIAYEDDAAKQYAFSKAGMQTVNSQRAEVLLPELTDFLAGKIFEDFDEGTNILSTTILTSTMLKKVKLVASRYLIISYGISSYTHAFIYDIALQRLGKVKLTHVDCFEYVATQGEISKETIGFLLSSGQVQTLDFSTPGGDAGVLILGRLQAAYNKMMTLHEVFIENTGVTDTLAVYTRASLDGKNVSSTVVGYLADSEEGTRNYKFRTAAVSHSLLFVGKFNLVGTSIRYVPTGRIRR